MTKDQIERIVSGGQTGADRAGLDFAIEQGIQHGGWCPRGRLAEDGPIPAIYNLREARTDKYLERTELNVRDSDGTVIFTMGAELRTGSKKTYLLAHKHGKPVLHLFQQGGVDFPELVLVRFIRDRRIRVLNVAGQRASKEPEIGVFVREVLSKALKHLRASGQPDVAGKLG